MSNKKIRAFHQRGPRDMVYLAPADNEFQIAEIQTVRERNQDQLEEVSGPRILNIAADGILIEQGDPSEHRAHQVTIAVRFIDRGHVENVINILKAMGLMDQDMKFDHAIHH
jgi:hypothetical protein